MVQHERTIYEDLTFASVCWENVMDYGGENPGQRNSTEPGLYVTKNLSAKWCKEVLISSSSDTDKFIPDFEGRIRGELKSKRLVNKAEISAHWDPRSSPMSRMIPTVGDFPWLMFASRSLCIPLSEFQRLYWLNVLVVVHTDIQRYPQASEKTVRVHSHLVTTVCLLHAFSVSCIGNHAIHF